MCFVTASVLSYSYDGWCVDDDGDDDDDDDDGTVVATLSSAEGSPLASRREFQPPCRAALSSLLSCTWTKSGQWVQINAQQTEFLNRTVV